MRVMKQEGMTWVRYVKRMGEVRNEYIILENLEERDFWRFRNK
jgi:hypothetical protein